ncbi:MAG: hypothetical protein U0414_09625 [Polyangiaceae bacterium]
MTKKIVNDALAKAATGDVERALETLRRADWVFVRRKLDHHVSAGPVEVRPVAERLRAAWLAAPNTGSKLTCPSTLPFDLPQCSLHRRQSESSSRSRNHSLRGRRKAKARSMSTGFGSPSCGALLPLEASATHVASVLPRSSRSAKRVRRSLPMPSVCRVS